MTSLRGKTRGSGFNKMRPQTFQKTKVVLTYIQIKSNEVILYCFYIAVTTTTTTTATTTATTTTTNNGDNIKNKKR